MREAILLACLALAAAVGLATADGELFACPGGSGPDPVLVTCLGGWGADVAVASWNVPAGPVPLPGLPRCAVPSYDVVVREGAVFARYECLGGDCSGAECAAKHAAGVARAAGARDAVVSRRLAGAWTALEVPDPRAPIPAGWLFGSLAISIVGVAAGLFLWSHARGSLKRGDGDDGDVERDR